MTQFNSFNNSSGSGKNFFGAMLVIALVLHAAVLVIPTGANSKGSNNSQTEDKKDNSQDKVQASPQTTGAEADVKKTPAKSASRKSPTPVKSLSQATKAKTPSKPISRNSKPTTSKSPSTPRQSTTSSSSKSSTAKSSKSSTSTASNSKPATTNTSNSTSTARQNNSNSSSSNSRQGQNSQNPTAKNPPNLTPPSGNQSTTNTKPNPTTPAKPPNAPTQPTSATIPINNFYKGIPYYFGSLLTSGGILKSEFNDLKKYSYIYYTSDSLEKVGKEFKQQLETKGFKLTETANEANFQVYKLAKDGKEYFLHLVNKNNRTAIFIDEKSYKLDELEDKLPEKKLPDIVSFYDAFKENIRDKAELQFEKLKKLDLDVLYQNEGLKKLKTQTETVEIDRLLLDTLQVVTPSDKPIEMKQLSEMITTELGKGDKSFKVTKVEDYGSDNLSLYEVTQGEFKIYMMLLATSDVGKVVSQTDKIPSQGDKLPSQSDQIASQGDKVMRTAILFSQKDPR